MDEKILEQYFDNMVIPQMIYEKNHSRKGGFRIRSDNGDYLEILYTWKKDNIYEGVALPARA